MSETLILHHYDASPYAEKVRLMFGLAGMRWQSLLSPVQPPRPNLDPLTGGYRRIPVAQSGADIFCDTALIAREVVRLSGCTALDGASLDADVLDMMNHAERDVFFAGIAAVPPARLLTTMLLGFGPLGTYRFIKDRAGLMKGGTTRPAQGARAKAILAAQLESLEARLAERNWLGGDTASLADFAVYHPLWLHAYCMRRPLAAGPNVTRWFGQVTAIGHGQREEITPARAFAAARDAQPRQLPDSASDTPVAVGSDVKVAPSDYGVVPITGTLAAVTADRIIVRRETPQCGQLHVHFPRAGYTITPA